MHYTTLISAQQLRPHLNNDDWVIVDCRFSLADSQAGRTAYTHGHLPNARYADLNRDLSGIVTDQTGRHPLPDFNAFAKKLGGFGISNRSQVVVYDDVGGLFAGRLWWLLRTIGHGHVAVLDGGLTDWRRQGLPLTTVLPHVTPTVYRPYLDTSAWLCARAVENGLARRQIRLLDARSPERFRGEQEPIDVVAGHIPGAVNRPSQTNLDKAGKFLSAAVLRHQFTDLLGDFAPDEVVHQCGSGVTACHNLLAMEHAGLIGSRLYAGSWSGWIKDRNRAVAVG